MYFGASAGHQFLQVKLQTGETATAKHVKPSCVTTARLSCLLLLPKASVARTTQPPPPPATGDLVTAPAMCCCRRNARHTQSVHPAVVVAVVEEVVVAVVEVVVAVVAMVVAVIEAAVVCSGARNEK